MKQANKAIPRKKEKWNFKPYLIIAAVLLLIVALAAVITLWQREPELPMFTYENGNYVDSENQITYAAAPFYYQAVLWAGEDYAYADSDWAKLYRVGYRDEDDAAHLLSAELWLTTDMEDGALLYYNVDKVDLPDMTEFEGDRIYICEPDGSGLFSTTAIEAETASRLLEDFFSAEGSDYDELIASCDLTANLKVSSSKYKWMYLNLWLYTDDDGNYYICETTTKKLIKTDEDAFEDIFSDPSDNSAVS